ncbi:MAG TPA: (E)-4-hydroxy-3-methylbut-2-enyl-diphosphate synthase [Chloroflexota bacterium]|nr:(E)-4-hydroxy-3-methylbut-2-enyl-diphosphate synthase [Chloroflexota bacterium]
MTVLDREPLAYAASPYARQRRRTRVVMIGDVGVGGDNPIRVQSMTTTRTQDTDATVAQVIRLVEAGCEIVRITAPTVADAKNLGAIKAELGRRGIGVPLVADIHFSPAAALEAALHVDKVRINPGNFADSKTFAIREYTDEQYAAELARIEERFKPVVLRCKERRIAMRIGTNHGSLSDRIMNRYGDTPRGMVESALEFLAICEKHGFHDVVFSMKASNPKVMIQAYRLLAARLDALGKPYPFHLGVTEAGEGEDGRIKSAVGIGSLLEDGIGDTIRVSLTEEPEAEVPVAFALGRRWPVDAAADAPPEPPPFDPYAYTRRATRPVRIGDQTIGGEETPRVIASIPGPLAEDVSPLTVARRLLVPVSKKLPRPDLLGVRVTSQADVRALAELKAGLERSGLGAPILARVGSARLAAPAAAHAAAVALPAAEAPSLDLASLPAELPLLLEAGSEAADGPSPQAAVEELRRALAIVAVRSGPVVASITAGSTSELIHAARRFAAAVPGVPLLLVAPRPHPEGPGKRVPGTRSAPGLERLLDAAVGLGSPLADGICDAVEVPTAGDPVQSMQLAFNVLQAAGARISKTDYVACPSCGRTLFDLQTTTARIKARTDHLNGVKIAIMGCIVNGPGEMADADFGYVGGAPGLVNLYVGKECVARGVPEAEADARLADLIKARGRWKDPE